MSRTKKPKELFTTGPWFGVLLQSPLLKRAEIRAEGNNLWIASTSGCAGNEREVANGALIACAPEMYYLLKRIKGMLQFCELEDKIDADTEHEIGALLAKARGEVLK